MKRDSVSAYVHMKHDTPLPLFASVNILVAKIVSSDTAKP